MNLIDSNFTPYTAQLVEDVSSRFLSAYSRDDAWADYERMNAAVTSAGRSSAYNHRKLDLVKKLTAAGLDCSMATSPEELKDLNFTITPSGTTVEYKGISYTPVEGSMPFSALMDKFYRAMLEASQEGLTANSDGILTLDAEGKKTEFTLSPTGLPLEAQIENGNFLIKFYNVTIKEDTDG